MMNNANAQQPGQQRTLDLMVTGNQVEISPQPAPTLALYNVQATQPTASFLDCWTAWKKGFRYILLLMLIFTLLTLALALVTNKTYTSKASLKIETDYTRILDYDVDTSRPPSYINDDVFYNTQYKLLRSRDLAQQVITDLSLSEALLAEKKYIAPVYSLSGYLRTQLEMLKQTLLPNASNGRKEMITPEEVFFRNLTISPVRRSRIIDVHYTARSPEQAKLILQSYVQNFIDLQQLNRLEATEKAKAYLSKQIAASREKMQSAEKKLLDYARANKIVDTNSDVSVIANNISLLNEAYIKAKSRRIDAESQLQNKQNISTILNTNSDPVIRVKKQELSSLQAQYSAKLSLFKPAYPAMQELRQQINQLQAYINRESSSVQQNTSRNMQANYQAALEEEKKLNREIKKLESNLLKFYENSIGYAGFKRDVDISRKLYEGLLQRLKEISVIGPVPDDNITVVDSPISPARRDGLSYAKYLALGGLLGFIFYSFIICLREMFKPKVRNESGLSALSRYPILTSVPKVSSAWFGLQTLGKRDAFNPGVAESFRYLRTMLQMGHAGRMPQVLHITSPSQSDGKSTVGLFLAVSLTNTGKRVLLIDADLRKPSLHKKLGLRNDLGLSNYLYNNEMEAYKSHLPGSSLFFRLITAGPAVNDPVDTLNSERFDRLIASSRRVFDHIIIDSPPVLGMADAKVIARQADTTLLVIANNRTYKADVQTTISRLESGGVLIAGLICNYADRSFSKHYYNTAYSDGRALIALSDRR